jgi:hypothetical protein
VAGALINGSASPVNTTDTIVQITWPSTFTTGTIFVKANNACGSSTERSLAVFSAPATATAINGRDTVCAGLIYTYSVSPLLGATTYNWTVPSSVTILSGQGTTTVSLQFNSAAGTRSIRVNGSNSCGVGTNFTKNVIAVACPRLGETVSGTSLILDAYPNPAEDMLNIIFSNSEAGRYNVNLVDLSGRIVRSEQIEAMEGDNRLIWDVSALQSGVYFLDMIGEEGRSTLRVVIE